MALTIKNAETERLSRELAGVTGESITSAVTVAVHDRLLRLRATQEDASAKAARILDLGRKIAVVLPAEAFRPEDLYDESGLPA